jgi:hypothetical protein
MQCEVIYPRANLRVPFSLTHLAGATGISHSMLQGHFCSVVAPHRRSGPAA